MANDDNLTPIRRALLSVSDKTGLVELAHVLRGYGVEIISTGGTAHTLREAGVSVRDVSELTGFPEMMDGRVKTLHPHVHGGLLALRDTPAHTQAAREHGIEMIDLVVVNLYPFEKTISRENVALEDAIENIDIGGPAMIRSAAKNFAHVAVIVSPDSYAGFIEEFKRNGGALSPDTRRRLAQQAFARTAAYDASINNYLSSHSADTLLGELSNTSEIGDADDTRPGGMFDTITFPLSKAADLRYGENPHQFAALYEPSEGEAKGIAGAEVLHGKEMSYNNYVDADAAWSLVSDFDYPTCAIIKHTNPAGCATHNVLEQAYRRALMCDPVSAFGGIVAFNTAVDEQTARALTEIFTEVVVAPSYTDDALTVLKTKKNLRVLRVKQSTEDALDAKLFPGYQIRTISGGFLVQTPDTHRLTRDSLRISTLR